MRLNKTNNYTYEIGRIEVMDKKRKKVAELQAADGDDELYCRPCNQHFNSVHNKREHLSGRRHLQVITKQDETRST